MGTGQPTAKTQQGPILKIHPTAVKIGFGFDQVLIDGQSIAISGNREYMGIKPMHFCKNIPHLATASKIGDVPGNQNQIRLGHRIANRRKIIQVAMNIR